MSGREGLRRAVHVGFGGIAWFIPILGWQVCAGVCATGVAFNWFLLPRLPLTRDLLRTGDDSGHLGIVFYPAVLLASCLVFREDHAPTQAAWCAMAFGDGLAPLFGQWLRRPSWPRRPDKAIPASLASFALAGIAAQSMMPAPTAWCAMGVAVLIEGFSGPVDDNLTVPVAAAVTAWWIGGLC